MFFTDSQEDGFGLSIVKGGVWSVIRLKPPQLMVNQDGLGHAQKPLEACVLKSNQSWCQEMSTLYVGMYLWLVWDSTLGSNCGYYRRV